MCVNVRRGPTTAQLERSQIRSWLSHNDGVYWGMIKNSMTAAQVAQVLKRFLEESTLEEVEADLIMGVADLEEDSEATAEDVSHRDYWDCLRADLLAEAIQDVLDVNREVPTTVHKRDAASLTMVPPGYVL